MAHGNRFADETCSLQTALQMAGQNPLTSIITIYILLIKRKLVYNRHEIHA